MQIATHTEKMLLCAIWYKRLYKKEQLVNLLLKTQVNLKMLELTRRTH